jgi:hypothetical protein
MAGVAMKTTIGCCSVSDQGRKKVGCVGCGLIRPWDGRGRIIVCFLLLFPHPLYIFILHASPWRAHIFGIFILRSWTISLLTPTKILLIFEQARNMILFSAC